MHQEQGSQLRDDGPVAQQKQSAQMRVTGLSGEHGGGIHAANFTGATLKWGATKCRIYKSFWEANMRPWNFSCGESRVANRIH